MTCEHKSLTIVTVEEVAMRYRNYPEASNKWGDTLWQDIIKVRLIECDDCGEDLTEELRGEIDW